MTKKNLGSLAVAAAFFAAACADPAGPSRALQPDAPLFAVSTVPGYPFPNPPSDGDIQLCKTSNVAGTFDFTLAGPAGTVSPVQIIIGAGGGTVCHPTPVYNSQLGRTAAGLYETVVITEQANAVPLTDIDIIRYLDPTITYGAGLNSETDDQFSVAGRTATVRINHDMARKVTFTNTAPPPGNKGCSQGYWGRSQHFDSWVPTGYATGDDFDATFGVNFFNPNLTLLQAVNQGGGGVKALGRQAVAALLNAAHPGVPYPLSEAQVLALIQSVTPANMESVKDLLDGYNNLGCTLN